MREEKRIQIPEFMLSPEQKKAKRKRRELMDRVSMGIIYTAIASDIWFCLALDQYPIVGIIGVIIGTTIAAITQRWRKQNDMD